MDTTLTQKAVLEALKGAWKKAIAYNRQILKDDPKNTEALNRLARAYAEIGNIRQAKCLSNKVLVVDPFNKIARKCLLKWKDLKKEYLLSVYPVTASAFIEEPGKTKIVPLLNLGSTKLLANLDAGDEVIINPQGRGISILSFDGKYIGRLPDNVGARIKNLIKGGNLYKAIIKSIDTGAVKVFLREVQCSSRQKQISSFPQEKADSTHSSY